MSHRVSSPFHIALIGGQDPCKEVLSKTTFDPIPEGENARIVAVADQDPHSPGMGLAREMGLITVQDYHELYRPEYQIHLMITLTPEEKVLQDILETKPSHIRLMPYPTFKLFWRAIRSEEEKLRERSQEMETILNGIQDFIFVITPEREIVEVNAAFLRQMGYAREEVIGRKCHEVFRKSNALSKFCNIDCPLTKSIRTRNTIRDIRTRVDHKGDIRYIDVSIFPIWEKDGRISKFIEVSRDITARRREEEELTRRLEQMVEERTLQLKDSHSKLLHQDKMASMGKLAASVVHEINNPIAGILNLAMLMKRILHEGPVSPEDLDRFGQYSDLMETETRRISHVVSNLLAFARQSRLELKEVDLNRLLEKTLFLNANLLKLNGVRVERHFALDLPSLMGSEDQLQQVFMNLISNAVEAMEASEGGVLGVGTEFIQESGTVRIRVEDTGIGIPQENIPRLFEPFFTTKKKGKGVGLGLSVAYGIIQDHDGSIRVESEVEKGTVFEIMFPLLRKPTQAGPGNGGFHGRD